MKKKKELKEIQLCVRVTKDLHKKLKSDAKKAKLSVSKYVRKLLEVEHWIE